LSLVGLGNQRPRGVDVALINEEWVGVHPVYLYWYALRPGWPELGDGHAGIEEQRAPCARAGLGQHLRREHAEREATVDQFVGQRLRYLRATIHQVVKAAFL